MPGLDFSLANGPGNGGMGFGLNASSGQGFRFGDMRVAQDFDVGGGNGGDIVNSVLFDDGASLPQQRFTDLMALNYGPGGSMNVDYRFREPGLPSMSGLYSSTNYSASEVAGDLVRESARGGLGIGDATRQGLWEVSMQADMAVMQGAKNATQWGRLSRFAGYGLDMQVTSPSIAQSVLSLSNSELMPALQSLGDNNLWGNSQARFSPITQILLGASPLGNHLGAGVVDNLPVIGLLSSAGGGRYGSQMVLVDQLQSIGAIDSSARATMAQAINASWQNATLNAAVGTLTPPLGLPRTILAEGLLLMGDAQAGMGGIAKSVKGLAAGVRTLGASLDLLEGLVAVGKATRPGLPVIPAKLYHYTNEAGMNGIVKSESLNPSFEALNPKDARYGDGQYLSDIPPGTRTPAELSKDFLGLPYQGRRFTHFVEIKTKGLNVIQGRSGVYVVPNDSALNLGGRITNSGKVTK